MCQIKKKIHNPKIIMRKTLEIPIEGYSIKCCSCCLVAVLSDSLVTPWTVAHQASLSMRFFRQEYWSGLPFSSSGDLPDPGIEPRSLALQADSLVPEPPGKPSNRNQVHKRCNVFETS